MGFIITRIIKIVGNSRYRNAALFNVTIACKFIRGKLIQVKGIEEWRSLFCCVPYQLLIRGDDRLTVR